jgi:hypothetical protein
MGFIADGVLEYSIKRLEHHILAVGTVATSLMRVETKQDRECSALLAVC